MEGVNTRRYLLVYLIALALVVALEVKIVGGLMTATLIAIPAVTAKLLSRNLKQYSWLGILFGIAFSIVGISLTKTIDQPAGILITLTAVITFLLVLAGKTIVSKLKQTN